jgi:hypothetical protein
MIVRVRVLLILTLLYCHVYARFTIVNETHISHAPFNLCHTQITPNYLYFFAIKNFQSTFFCINAVTLQIIRSYTISGFLVSYLPPLYDVLRYKIYLIYMLFGETQYRISSFNMINLSVLQNQTFSIPFELGIGILNSYTKSLYIPEEDMPLGNQLKQISLDTFNDTGKTVNVDEYGIISAKHQDPNKPYLYSIQYHLNLDLNITDYSVVKYNLETFKVENVWNTTNQDLFIYSSCYISRANLLAFGLGSKKSPLGIALFNLTTFQIVKTLLVDPSFKQQGYPTRITANTNYLYFTTSNQEVGSQICLVWRVPLASFDQQHLEYIQTPKELACNVVMLESNENGAYFAIDLGQRLFATN